MRFLDRPRSNRFKVRRPTLGGAHRVIGLAGRSIWHLIRTCVAGVCDFIAGRLPTAYFTRVYAPFWFIVAAIGVLWAASLVPPSDSKRKYVISHLAWQDRNPDGYRVMVCTMLIGALIHVPIPVWLYRKAGQRTRFRLTALVLMHFGIVGLITLSIESGFWPALGKWHKHAHSAYAILAFGGLFFGAMLFQIILAKTASHSDRRTTHSIRICRAMIFLGALGYLLLEGQAANQRHYESQLPTYLHWLVNFAFWEWSMVLSIVCMLAITMRSAARR